MKKKVLFTVSEKPNLDDLYGLKIKRELRKSLGRGKRFDLGNSSHYEKIKAAVSIISQQRSVIIRFFPNYIGEEVIVKSDQGFLTYNQKLENFLAQSWHRWPLKRLHTDTTRQGLTKAFLGSRKGKKK